MDGSKQGKMADGLRCAEFKGAWLGLEKRRRLPRRLWSAKEALAKEALARRPLVRKMMTRERGACKRSAGRRGTELEGVGVGNAARA